VLARRLKATIRQLILPPLVIVGLNLVAATSLFSQTQAIWLFKNTKNWVQAAAVLTFTEAVLCFIIAGTAGMGRSEQVALVTQVADGEPVDIKQYAKQREQSISQGLRFAAVGGVLIILTLMLQLLSQ
jgi:hypothetical protein